jgi:transposase
MPRGRHLSPTEKQAIYFNHILMNESVEDVYLHIFSADPNFISFNYLNRICSFLKTASDMEIEYFLNNADNRKIFAGRGKQLDADQTRFILTVTKARKGQTIKEIRDLFFRLWFAELLAENNPSENTIRRTLRREHLTYHVIETRNMLQNPTEQIEYLESIRHVDPSRIIDIDGMSQSRKDFKGKYGWAPSDDEDYYQLQITIHSRSFSVHAAYSQFGFIAWEIFEETAVTQIEITHFLEHFLMPFVLEDSFCIIDNARNQRTPQIRNVLEGIFHGLYMFSPAYTPEFKPIERGFSNIKNWIRRHDTPASALDPIGLIQEAFRLYSVTGALGLSGLFFVNIFNNFPDVVTSSIAIIIIIIIIIIILK